MIVSLLALACCVFGSSTGVARADKGADFYNQGLAAAKAGHAAIAVHDFEMALLHTHNDPVTFYQLGLAFKQTKQMNYAAWAIATALSDTVFSALNSQASRELDAVQNAGGVDSGPPSLLSNVSMSAMVAPKVDPAQYAAQQSAAAFTALEQGAYFVSPGYSTSMTVDRQGELSQAAQSAHDGSNTSLKFVFLDGTPAPYADLWAYARGFLRQLGIQRAVLIVVTPGGVAASSDRMGDTTSRSIVSTVSRQLGTGDSAALATGIAAAIIQRADADEGTSQKRDLAIAVAIGAIALVALSLGIRRVLKSPNRAGALPRRGQIRAGNRPL